MKHVDAKAVMKALIANNYDINEDNLRRVDWYKYEKHTVLSIESDRIVVRTEMPIKGIFNTLILYSNGDSDVKMEFEKN